MTNPVAQAKQELLALVNGALSQAMTAGELPACEALPAHLVEIPSDTAHGNFASNAAMVCARSFRMAPRKVAEAICAHLNLEDADFLRAEIAGPGFINFFLSPRWYTNVLRTVLEEGASYGRTTYGAGEKVQVEFVSANPTGPMHMGNARGGALGDCLAEAMDWAGYQISREFYINDAGNQIEKFANSLSARYLQLYLGEDAVPFPEDGYHGDDIVQRAKEFAALHGDSYVKADECARKDALTAYALPKNVDKLREDLGTYRIRYDEWFRESTLHPDGIDEAIEKLRARDMIYEQDGAIWYKATEKGGEKDEVLVRANGFPTYFAADIAYHYNKFAIRGFNRVINVWGADHHGHVARLKGAMDAIGLDGSKLDIVLMQLVRLMKDGAPVKMSKRTGKAISLTDLLEEVPVDAARFFFNMREPNSSFDFDLDLALKQNSQNPVYYVQYAHARICSILARLEDDGIVPRSCTEEELEALSTPEELKLLCTLARFPQEIIDVTKNYDPAGLTKYALDIATDFHKFYDSCRVQGVAEPLMQGRMALCNASRTVLHNVLTLLKITAPESMEKRQKQTLEGTNIPLPLLLDGASGTRFMAAGMPAGVCVEKWCSEHPDVVADVARSYADAGSDVVYAPTFLANAGNLKMYGLSEQVRELNTALVSIVKEAVKDRNVLVAGDMSTTGQMCEPFGDMEFIHIVGIYAEQASALAEAGVDLIVIETIASLAEARAAVLAARQTGLPLFVTMTVDAEGRTLWGEDVLAAMVILQDLGISAFGLNCSHGPAAMLPLIQRLAPYAKVPLIAKPNAGEPPLSPVDYRKEVAALMRAGVSIVGGCCGTDPNYIALLRKAVDHCDPERNKTEPAEYELLAAARNVYYLSNDLEYSEPVICSVDMADSLLDCADECGGAVLVHLDTPDDGYQFSLNAHMIDMPVAFESESLDALENALLHYQGKAIINSTRCEIDRDELRSLGARFGAIVL